MGPGQFSLFCFHLALSICLGQGDDSKMFVSGSAPRQSIIPLPPPTQEFGPRWVSVVDSDLNTNITLEFTPTLTLPSLRDELSYNCLSNQFELAVQIQDGAFTAIYHAQGNFDYYLGLIVRLTATGHLDFVCDPAKKEGECLVILRGQLDPKNDAVIVDTIELTSGVDIVYRISYGTWMGLPIVTEPQLIQAKGSLEVLFDRPIFNQVASDLKPYLNQLLSNTTVTEFISQSGGDCDTPGGGVGGESRLAILPQFPPQLEFDKSYDYEDDHGWFNMTLDFSTVISGMSDLKNELSYNCLSSNLELALLLPNFNMEGPFFLEGLDSYTDDKKTVEVAGTLVITCEYPKPPGLGCFKTVFGKIVDNVRNVVAQDLTFSPRFFYEVIIDYALVNGEPVEHIYLGDYLNHYWSRIYADWAHFIETQLNDQLSDTSMEELLKIMGGDCAV